MKYKLHWLDGKTEVIEGENLKAALSAAGYGGGALQALDYWEEEKEEEVKEEEVPSSSTSKSIKCR